MFKLTDFTFKVTDNGLTILNSNPNQCVQTIKKIEKGDSYFNSRIIGTQDGKIKIDYDETGFKIRFIKEENTLLRSLGIPMKRSEFIQKFNTIPKLTELCRILPAELGGPYIPHPLVKIKTLQNNIIERIDKIMEDGCYY
jgi:hypothetical protein